MRFSANLGFLWNDRPLPEAIRCAKAAGFDAVECHWPYDFPAAEVKSALDETGLKMLGLNTRRGKAGENGLSALPGREADARAAIDEAAGYAEAIGAGAIHVMAGFASGTEAHRTFVSNLAYACSRAPDKTILIEPLNAYDAPGYFLSGAALALSVIEDVRAANIKLMFDCYHIQLLEGDLTNRFLRHLPHIGHVQFASVPDRGPPDHGEVAYAHIFKVIEDSGYSAPLGAEYKPRVKTEDTLGWIERFK